MSVQNTSATTSATTTDGTVNFDTIANMYMSALATEATNGTNGFADLSKIAELYNAADENGNNLLEQDEFLSLLTAIETTVGKDLFEFDTSGKNIGTNEETGGTADLAKPSIDANGVLFADTCAVTGAKNCTCKVTDGFASVTKFFDSLAKDNKNAGVFDDAELSVGEEDALLDNYLNETVIKEKLSLESFGLTSEANEALDLLNQALNLLDQGKTLTDEQKTIINDYIKTLSPEVLDTKLIEIFGSVDAGKNALGQLGVTIPDVEGEEEEEEPAAA